LIEPKGLNIANELDGTELLIKKMGGQLVKIDNFKSANGTTSNVVHIKKITTTNTYYPRP
jgi:hypothetical protein